MLLTGFYRPQGFVVSKVILLFRCLNASSNEIIKISPPKPRRSRAKINSPSPLPTVDPQIMHVWSCKDPNSKAGQFINLEELNRTIKAEMGVCETFADSHYSSEPEPPSIDMSTIISDDKLSGQLLTLIDPNVCSNLVTSNQTKPAGKGRPNIVKSNSRKQPVAVKRRSVIVEKRNQNSDSNR